jgi:photosystem II stability/assembly factor-like uncharacterized protein
VNLEEELGPRIRNVIRNEELRFPVPNNLDQEMIRAVHSRRPRSTQPGLARQLSMAAGVVIFALALGAGLTAIHALSRNGSPAATKKPAPQTPPPPVQTPSSYPTGGPLIAAVKYLSSQHGWVVTEDPTDNGTRRLLMTSDGGAHWSSQLTWTGRQNVGRNSLPRIILIFGDNSHGFLLDPAYGTGNAVLFRTTDGKNWKALQVPGVPAPGWPLTFIDARNGWLLADANGASGQSSATIYRTQDSGDHWSRVAHVDLGTTASNGLSSAGDKDSIVFASPTAGWLTAFSTAGEPLLWRTSDGGTSWIQQRLPAPAGVYIGGNALLFVPELFPGGAAVLPMEVTLVPQPNGQPQTVPPDGYPSALYVYTSASAGQAWNGPIRLPAVGSLQYPLVWTILDGKHWWVGTRNRLWKTSDGGASWMTLNGPGLLASIDFATVDFGWAVEVYAPSQYGTLADSTALAITSDGGSHWANVALPSAP